MAAFFPEGFFVRRISSFSQRPLPSRRNDRSISLLTVTHPAMAWTNSRQAPARRRK
jgi:hypothetical protein